MNTFPMPTQVTYPPITSETGPTSREWLSTNLGVMVFISAPLSRRAMQFSPLTLTLATFFNSIPSLEGIRIQEGSLCMTSFTLGVPSWDAFGMVIFA